MNVAISKWNIHLELSRFSISELGDHDPWDISSDKTFEWEFKLIPDDLDFWNHVLWVVPNPDLVKKIMPPYLKVFEGNKGYFVMENIPY